MIKASRGILKEPRVVADYATPVNYCNLRVQALVKKPAALVHIMEQARKRYEFGRQSATDVLVNKLFLQARHLRCTRYFHRCTSGPLYPKHFAKQDCVTLT